ncbi:lipopolysaccharide biosynthesis protein [Haloglomus litoreum]|uniref:lipopolysaccharide biosynthesis protein n=1 Tax=Haloglomus litoreum TaxID=3034026 RepID=UPI0023E8DBE1|nr:lipopolysaccharide biosynthesis protein [Haloglomus sp. DT116]
MPKDPTDATQPATDADGGARGMDFDREVVSGTAAQLIRVVIGLLGVVVFAVVLGPASFGGATLVLTIVAILEQPVFGWAMACKQRLAAQSISGGAALVMLTGGTLAWTGIVLGATVLFSPTIMRFTGLQWGWLFVPLLLLTTVLLAALRVLIEGKGRIGAATWYETAAAITTTPLQVCLVLVGYGAYGMLGGLTVGAGILVPVAVRTFGWKVERPTRTDFQSVWEYARWGIAQSLLGRVFARLDVLLLGFLLGPLSVGWYEVAWKVVLPAGIISQVAGGSLMTSVASATGGCGRVTDEKIAEIRRTLGLGAFLAIPVVFGALVVGESLLIAVFGAAYRDATPLLIGLAGFQVLVTQTTPLLQTLNGVNRIRITVPITAITLIINAVLGLLLVPEVGAVGVVIATLVAQLIQYLLSLAAVMESIGRFVPITRLLTVETIAGAGMAGLLANIPGPANTLPVVIGYIVLGGASYFVLVLALSPEARTFLQKLPIGPCS